VKCIVGVRGSGFVNALWMEPNTVMIVMQVKAWEPWNVDFARSCGLFVFQSNQLQLMRFSPRDVDVQHFINVIRETFSYMNWKE
jgi:hypothetical protein